MKIEIGEFYYVSKTSPYLTIPLTKSSLDCLTYFKCVDVYNRLDDGIRWYFEDPTNIENRITIEEYFVPFNVFKSKAQFYKMIVDMIQSNLWNDHIITPEVMKIIKESQEEEPEYWV